MARMILEVPPQARQASALPTLGRPSPPLFQAHQDLDLAMDRCYRPEPFPSERRRVEYLFGL